MPVIFFQKLYTISKQYNWDIVFKDNGSILFAYICLKQNGYHQLVGFKGKITGNSHDLHGKIWLVSGPFFVNPLNHGIEIGDLI